MSSLTRDLLRDLTASRPEYRIQDGANRGCASFAGAPTTLRELLGRLRGHDGVAFRFNDSSITYAELWSQVVSCAHWLRSQDVDLGDRVAVVSRNHPAVPTLFWACQAIGAVFVPLNPSWTGEELEHALSDCQPSQLFVQTELLVKFSSPWADCLIEIGAGGGGTTGVDWRAGIAGSAPVALPEANVRPEDTATIVYTSGTTGRARGVVHTNRNHGAAVQNALITSAAIGSLGAPGRGHTSTPVILHVLPWFHVAGLSAIYTSMLGGATNVVVERWDVAEVVRIIEAERVTSMGSVPTMLAQLVSHVREKGGDLSSLASVASGAAAVPPPLLEAVSDHVGHGAMLFTGYGLTETTASIALVLGSDLFEKPESVGYPYPVNQVRLVDDSMQDVAPGQSGEIWVSGPTVASGYWRDEESTKHAFVDGGFRTGDLGRMDDDGYLYIVGRIKDVIIRGGENIQAAEVEAAVAEVDGVMGVAVVGVPHPTLGEEVVAVVTTYPSADVSDAALESHCRARLAAYKVPSRFVRDLEIPRNATGKSLKDALRRSLEQRM